MNAALLTLALVTVTPGGGKFADRERHPLAPSLPLLTEKEQAAIERVIDRFIEYDIGKLKGAPAAKAVTEFKSLGPEAIPALLDGLNKAASLEGSCPAVLIAKKLAQLLSASSDPELLDFARGMIGVGVTARRHTVVLKDLKVTCQLRKAYLQRVALMNKGSTGKGPAAAGKPLRSMTVADLAAEAGSERGPRLKLVLTELEKRKGPQVLDVLGAAADTYDKDIQQHARGLLDKHLARQPAALVKDKLKDDRAEVRAAAARAVATRGLRYGAELIDLLTDSDKGVRQAARQALVRISRGQDYGPEPGASEDEVTAAVRDWSAWWTKQSRRQGGDR
jgi:hypothetical protein